MNSPLLVLFLEEETPLFFTIIVLALIAFTVGLFLFFSFRSVFNFFEMAWIEYFKKKQFFNHIYFLKKNISNEHKSILRQEFSFYKRLSDTEKRNFEHRIAYYLKNWKFIGKDLEVNNRMKILVSATAAKLTFGLRDYRIDSVDKIIFYPEEYYSTINEVMHKGEFNMAYRALIFSWKDLKVGYEITNDNINLAVHECIHAMHFSFLKSRNYSTSAAIFIDSFHELTTALDADESLKQRLVSSEYIRDYAFENRFEFISVLVENFIETPAEFRTKFPRIYAKVKEMLNFNFAGY